jgi:hypothetical protein
MRPLLGANRSLASGLMPKSKGHTRAPLVFVGAATAPLLAGRVRNHLPNHPAAKYDPAIRKIMAFSF